MNTILFYGNCQLHALYQIMNKTLKNYNCISITCHSIDITEQEFTNTIKNASIIITQPISDNYRNLPYLSTKYILNNTTAKIIIFPSLYFNFYYVDLKYHFRNGDLLRIPSDYHYENIIENYNNNRTYEYYLEHYVNNVNLRSNEELITTATNSINELVNRENEINNDKVNLIKVSDYIRENYKNKLLFYSMNHPSKYVFQYIALKICDLLKLNPANLNLSMDPLRENERGILYRCIQNVVNFDISIYRPRLSSGNLEDIHNIYNRYIEIYKTISNKI